jgi:hypothetical protein
MSRRCRTVSQSRRAQALWREHQVREGIGKPRLLMMLGRECLTLMKRMMSIALSEASGRGERQP